MPSSTSCRARPDDLPGALSDLHLRGLRIAGADGDAPLTARQTDLRGPLAIVVGSEGQGLGPGIRRRCDVFMRIPMKGAVGSLECRGRRLDPVVRGGRPARGRRRTGLPKRPRTPTHPPDRKRARKAKAEEAPPTAETDSDLLPTMRRPRPRRLRSLPAARPPRPNPTPPTTSRAEPRTLDPSDRSALSSPGAEMGHPAVWPCPSRRRSSIGRAAVL